MVEGLNIISIEIQDYKLPWVNYCERKSCPGYQITVRGQVGLAFTDVPLGLNGILLL